MNSALKSRVMKSEPAEETGKPLVITVHGVGIFGRSGAWQPEVASVLGEHFRFRHIRHHYYCLFAGTELVFEPLVLLLLVPLWLYIAHTHWSGRWFIAAAFISAILAVAAYMLRRWRHRLACESFWNDIKDICRQSDERPHLIAHSLGSYLSCRTLQDNTGLMLRRVILVGSVVHEEFPWMELSQKENPQFEAVFNEVAPLDLVVRAATLFRSWLPDPRFGSAGIGGFAGDFVHYVNEPLLPCALCRQSWSPLHNVQYRHADHSSNLLNPKHASVFWLPYLWGYDPAQFARFSTLCADAARFERSGDVNNFAHAISQLRVASWGVPGLTLIRYVRTTAWRTPDNHEEASIVLVTWLAIVRAQAAVFDPAYQNRAFWLRCLRPTVAIEYALNKVLSHGA